MIDDWPRGKSDRSFPTFQRPLTGEEDETIQPLHDQPEQLLSTGEPTEWKWLVQAKKDGRQTLTVTVYRLVQYDGQDYWREKTYEKNIDVRVTLPGLIRRFDWEWLVGLVVTALLVPLLFRYLDGKKKVKDSEE